jgi:hypothetical protein
MDWLLSRVPIYWLQPRGASFAYSNKSREIQLDPQPWVGLRPLGAPPAP